MLATLKADAAAGSLRDELILVTNDANPQTARVPVPVEAIIQPAIAVHPSPLWMGSVAPGESVARQLIVHGNKPFRVVRVESSDKRFRCQAPEGVAAMHRLPVTFAAAADEPVGQPGAKIHIVTDAEPGRAAGSGRKRPGDARHRGACLSRQAVMGGIRRDCAHC